MATMSGSGLLLTAAAASEAEVTGHVLWRRKFRRYCLIKIATASADPHCLELFLSSEGKPPSAAAADAAAASSALTALTAPNGAADQVEQVAALYRRIKLGDLIRVKGVLADDGAYLGRCDGAAVLKMRDWTQEEIERARALASRGTGKADRDGRGGSKAVPAAAGGGGNSVPAPRPVRKKHGSCAERSRGFAEFLISHFGLNRLNSGAGVFDVAGGRGDLSCELAIRGVRCTLVDPRTRAGRLPKKLRRRLTRTQGAKPFAILPVYFPSGERPSADDQQRLAEGHDDQGLLEVALETASYDTKEDEEQGQEEQKGQEGQEGQDKPGNDDNEGDEKKGEKKAAMDLKPIALAAGLIAGLHPDQATEGIVDFAVANRKAFAVVPCCVFSRLAPGRRLPSGELVVTRHDFVRYLANKDPSIQIKQLAFGGANEVVFASFDESAASERTTAAKVVNKS